ncbi:MAG: dihydrolipoyl dehydrogenase [Gammaproteobacteria bacterium]|nr:MAG: dihydrolipoyl dehydrogenase [Gammaproteobacteria bacterium]
MSNHYDIIIVGAGPAGYVAAIRCAQLGMKTACIDKWLDKDGQPSLGGTCLNAGCIPSKALLESSEWYDRLQRGMDTHGIAVDGVTLDVAAMIASKDAVVRDLTGGIASLFKTNGVEWVQGRGQLMPDRQVDVTGHDGCVQTLNATHVILAPGSVPVPLAVAPLNNDTVVDSEGALEWTDVPRRLGIIGAGIIGLELGSVWRRLGAEVTLLEAQDVFLSMADQQIAKAALRSFRKQGLDVHLGACVKSTTTTDDGVFIEYENSETENSLTVDRLIVAVGRQPCTEGLASAEAALLLNEHGFIHIDEDCATSAPGVYAIGDAVRGPMLAHKGSEEGVAVAERIAGQHSEVNYEVIPSVVYTHPEIAWVGRTEEALKQAGTDYRTGTFPFAASGRARAMQETDGMVKILSDAVTDRVLGVHILGPSASELIAQAVTAMEFDASSEDIARTIFAHPTLSEALHEAALAIDNRAIHMARSRRR